MKTRGVTVTHAKGQGNFGTLSDEPHNIFPLQGQVPCALNDQAIILKERGDLDGAMALHEEESRLRTDHPMQSSRRLLPSESNQKN